MMQLVLSPPTCVEPAAAAVAAATADAKEEEAALWS